MRKYGWLIAILFVLLMASFFLVLSRQSMVQSGVKLTCPLCQSVFFNNVEKFRAVKSEAGRYKVIVKKEFCPDCQNGTSAIVQSCIDAFNQRDTAGIVSLFSRDAQDIAVEMAEKASSASPLNPPLGQDSFKLLTPGETNFSLPGRIPFAGEMSREEIVKKTPVWVKVPLGPMLIRTTSSSPRGETTSEHIENVFLYFLVLKEDGQWKIRTLKEEY